MKYGDNSSLLCALRVFAVSYFKSDIYGKHKIYIGTDTELYHNY